MYYIQEDGLSQRENGRADRESVNGSRVKPPESTSE